MTGLFRNTRMSKVAFFNWSPKIGDPTIGGWLTVALYLLTSLSCWTSARKIGLHEARSLPERRAWRFISALFLGLGLNKQLDLQTAMTEAGRFLAHIQGWYAQREFVQLAFIALVAMTCLVAAITLLIWARHAPIPTFGSDRRHAGSRLCIDPRGILPPHGSLYWNKNSGFALELDSGN